MAPTKNTKPTRLSAVLRNHRLAALSPSQWRKGASWLARKGVDVAQFKSARQVLAAQNALVSFVNNCSPRTIVKNLRELDAATEEVDPGVIVVQPDLSQELKTSKKEVELYVQLLNDAEKTADANNDKYCTLLYNAETEIGTLKAIVGELKTEKVALKALLKAEQGKREAAEKELEFSAVMFDYAENKADAEICALQALLDAERLKHKTLVDSLSNMRVVLDQSLDEVPTATCVRCKSPVSTHAGTGCA